jgi:hypothetical protein
VLVNDSKIDVKVAQFTILLHPYKEIKDKFTEMSEELKEKGITFSEKFTDGNDADYEYQD